MKLSNKPYDIIDSSNYKLLESELLGYKINDYAGCYLKIQKICNQIKISGSYIKPIVYYYQSNNYWCISLSLPKIIEHLLKLNKLLTIDKKSIEYLLNVNLNNYNNHDTNLSGIFNQIHILDNFNDILLNDSGIHFVQLNDTLFSKQLDVNSLTTWYNDYKEYIMNLPEYVISLSGGTDSRFNLSFANENATISTKKCKLGHENDKISDEYISKRLCEKLSLKTSEIQQTKTRIPEEVIYYMCSCNIMPIYFSRFQWSFNSTTYALNGSGTETLKCSKWLNSKQFIFNRFRRHLVHTFFLYSLLVNKTTICPFMDKRILEIHSDKPYEILKIVYDKFAKDLLTIEKFLYKGTLKTFDELIEIQSKDYANRKN